MVNLKQKATDFFNGYLYPIYVAFFVLIGHVCSIEIYSIPFIAISVCAGFILCKDLKFFISPLICFYYIFSRKSLRNDVFYSTPYLIFYGVIVFAILASMAIHFIIYKKEIKIKNFTSSAFFKGLVLLAITFLLNGLSSLENYNVSNFAFGLLIVISFTIPFFLFSINLEIDKNTKNYLFYVLILTSIVIMAEFLYLYINNNVIQNGTINKGALDLGWGVSNNIGAIFAMFMPIYFYFAGTTKHTLLFYLGGLLTYVFVLLTLSRAAILFATPILMACVLFLCIYKHKQRKQAILCTILLFSIAVVACFLLRERIYAAFNQIIRAGFSDSGRFEYYRDGMNKFFSSPILGVGFGNSHGLNTSFVIVSPNYFHSTVIQLLASCGAIGSAAYAYHRYQTIKLFISVRKPYSFYMAMSILALLFTSLLDVHLFIIYPTLIYSTILCIFEKQTLYEQENVL